MEPAAHAAGWQEAHQTSDDVRVTVAQDGMATVVHHLRYRVVAGRFKSFDFGGIDPRAEVVPQTVAFPEKGNEIAAKVEPNAKAPGSVRIALDDAKGLGRGIYTVDLTYKLDLVATKMLVRDGAMWRLAWSAPPSGEGHDGARVVFELPPAPTEPRLASTEQAATTVATFRRMPEKDELELVRAHVPRGEGVVWSARVDPKAFPLVTAPELRAAPAAVAASTTPNRVPAALVACGFAVIAGLLALALRTKQAAVAHACAASRSNARPLIPVPGGAAPFVYGAVTVAALAALLWANPTVGALLVVLAMALAAHRAPAVIERPRGPGRWRTVSDEDVLLAQKRPSSPGDLFDVGTTKGRLVALALVAAVASATVLLATRVAGAALAIPLGSMVLVPLFVTGTRAQLPPKPSELSSRFLRTTRDRLARLADLTHLELACVARFGEGTQTFDEVRLTCAPADRIPGLRTIELALAAMAPGGNTAVPEVLVRFDDASAAAEKIARIAPGVAVVPGRAPEEKVLRLSPRVPTPAFAARLLARLSEELEGRRASDRPRDTAGPEPSRPARAWKGKERRTPPGTSKRPSKQNTAIVAAVALA
ncbi:hypothetical protein AKJ09_06388 [Labilithrix luteola]|uniref:Uncharacterized protein n=1 Tax=Labilithrix luteola TaxID=1391654 RepID=A0A0K1Q2X8_9BACT|nr:hypothetical protein AKJ09_06388 [Labilithrix luteola]